MKILHVNTATSGGAAIAAIRLHCGMLEYGLDSKLITLSGSKQLIPKHFVYDGPVLCTKPSYPELTFKNWLKEKLFKIYNREIDAYDKKNAYSKGIATPKITNGVQSFELFSIPENPYDITQTKCYQEADIIHLHWVEGFLDYSSFFEKNKKPVVWTLHDECPYLGGFHYQGDVNRNQLSHGKINEQIRQQKKNAVQNASCKITVVSPSKWLAEKAAKSEVFQGRDVVCIRNGIDRRVFQKRDRAFSRELLGLPKVKKIFLFASADLNNYRKGVDLLLPILQDTALANALFLLVGDNFKGDLCFNLKNLGTVSDERLMSIIYSAADAFILSSREDNLPNTLVEAIACGTPLLAFDIGDNRSFIGSNGKIASDVNELREILINFDPTNLNSSNEQKDFDMPFIVESFQNLYTRTLNA
jgi:glycosyltransferase involved in cell wall biosynthesis